MTKGKFKIFAKYGLPTLLLAFLVIGLGGVLPAAAQAGILDHVTITPASSTLAPGATQPFTAQAFDAANNPIAGLTFLWNVAAGGGTISPTGLFTAGSTQATFTNTVQAFAVQGAVIKFGSATVTVAPPAPGPLDHVTVSPASPSVVAGGTQQFTAQGFDAANVPITGLSFAWNVAAGGGAINASGLFTAGATTGTFTNTVQAVAVQSAIIKIGTASVTVTAAPGPLDHVTVSPANATLAVGGTQQFTAQGFDSANVPISGLSFTWSVVAGGGLIDASGLFTAGSTTGAFTNTVQAVAVQGAISKTGLASVTVTTAPVPVPIPVVDKPAAKKLLLLVDASVDALGFEHFLGAQWSIKEDGQTMMVKAIPGVVKAISETSITLLPTGQTDAQVFNLAGSSRILTGQHALKVGDKAVVVLVDGAMRLVIPVPIRGVSDLDKEDRRGPNRGKDDDDDDVRDQLKELKEKSHDQIKGMRDAVLDQIKELRGNLRDQQKELRQGSNRGRG